MSSLTSGIVRIEDGIKNAVEYQPPRKVAVELHFDVAPGTSGEAALDAAGTLARRKVRELLGYPGEEAHTRAAVVPAAAADAGVNDPADVDARIAALTAKQVAKKEANRKAAAAPKPEPVPFTQPADTGQDIASIGDIPADPESGQDIGQIAPEPAPPVTDATLHEAIQKTNTRISNPQVIRELISSYRPDPTKPFSVTQLPQTLRGEFLERLAAL